MPWVTVNPAGIRLEVRADESVAEAAWRQGYIWPTQCYGQIDCMSCFTRITGGELCALPAEEEERDGMRLRMNPKLRSSSLVRLGCQLKVVGDDLVVEKPGFRVADPEDNNMVGAQAPASTTAPAPTGPGGLESGSATR